MGKEKVRFDGLDVSAMVAHLERELIGRRIINIYDGVSENDSFLIKFDGDTKQVLVLESGIRFHTTKHASSLQAEGMPSPFTSKLRKHLRGLRMERITQLGNYDRVVNFVFGSGENRCSLILELYARGNLLLTTAGYQILALLRSHEYEKDDIHVQVGHVYPVTYATSIGKISEGLLAMSGQQCIEWCKSEMPQIIDAGDETRNYRKKKDNLVVPLKAFLLKPSSGVYQYGPSLIEHCILLAQLDPNTKISPQTIETALSKEEWEQLVTVLIAEGTKVIANLKADGVIGHILHRPRDNTNGDVTSDTLPHSNKTLEDFQPHILKQHEGRPTIDYSNFSEAVDDYFAHIGGQKRHFRAENAERVAKEKLEKIKRDQEQRVEALNEEIDRMHAHATLIEAHAESADKALGVINSALDTGMDWEALEQLVQIEKNNRNPVALLIEKLELDKETMVLALSDTTEANKVVSVIISLQDSAYGNAREMFAKYRAFKEKSQKTLESSTKALKAAEINAQKQLQDAQLKSKMTATPSIARKPGFYEKFHYFVTSDNYLVLGGKDAHQNEQLVKRYLRPGDAYLHADVHGAASCILRAKRHRKRNGKTEALPLSDQALREAGNFTICRSNAWGSRMVTSAWWVEAYQVTKTAPSGEYLTVGSFMVRGKKNFLPPTPLEMGLAILFRLGDEDSIARHQNDRRDFALLNLQDEVSDEEETELEGVVELVDEEITTAEGAFEIGSNESIDQGLSQLATFEEMKIETKDTEKTQLEADRDLSPKGAFQVVEESSPKEATPKKGMSTKVRKLVKKYGSLEAAEKAAIERENAEQKGLEKVEGNCSINALTDSLETTQAAGKRGKKTKMKRAAIKYADQDDEDRELALLVLHGGEKKEKEKKGKNGKKVAPTSETQEKAAADTTTLLVKNSKAVAEQFLPVAVRNVLAECVTAKAGEASDFSEVTTNWEKFDADVLEQVVALETEEKQLVASKRLLFLKQSTRIDNFSASLAGIVRTIRKFGHENLETEFDGVLGDGKRKTKNEKIAEKEAWRETLAGEGIAEGDGFDEGIDDTIEMSKLTGRPLPEDTILYAVPVCAPFQTLAQYKYRVKLTPGSQKRGKAAKQCVEMFLHDGSTEKSTIAEREKELIKRVADNDWVQVICADVKISAPGASKTVKKQKSGKPGVGGKSTKKK